MHSSASIDHVPEPWATRLRWRLSRGLPGPGSMMDLAPAARSFVAPHEARAAGSREGGALLLLYPIEGVIHTVLTLRSAGLRDHAGQISLPGGRIEPGETAQAAALREAWEELAIPESGLDVVGLLTPIYIPPSNFLVHPVVAVRASRPAFRLQAAEVAEAIEAPVAHFVDDRHQRVETWDIRGELRRVPFFAVGPHKVWGATAMILAEFACVWQQAMAGETPSSRAQRAFMPASRRAGINHI